jgi:hypothetical protein
METTRLVYASVARPGLRYADVMELLIPAADRNVRRGLTGVLCFSAGAFLQVLEGARGEVSALYNRIAHDTRHSQVELLLCEPLKEREFAGWSMKLIGADDAPTAARRELLIRHTGSPLFDPHAMTGAVAVAFLCELAEMERHALV